MYEFIDLLLAAAAGVFVGAALVYLWVREWISPRSLGSQYCTRAELVDAHTDHQQTQQRLTTCSADLAAANVQADTLAQQLDRLEQDAAARERRADLLREQLQLAELSASEARSSLKHLTARLESQKSEFESLRRQAREEFSNVSSQLLRSSGTALREEHQRSLRELLDPMRTKLSEFQQQVDRKFSDEGKDKAALRVQIEQLTALNQDLSHEARQLTRALKGDSKSQGDWGELQLERLLEAAGLQAETHFETQTSFRSEAGAVQRPDCIVRLPQNRCIVVDSKVSLTAYERYCACDGSDIATEQIELAAHVRSLKVHIKQLSAKRYQDLYGINCPDYVLLFVPLEPAFIAAVRERPALFTEALAANIVLVSPSTLLATMRTVAYIWQQDDQQANAEQIAAVGGKLYDKFVGFVEDMDAVGTQLNKAQNSYDDAMNKLSKSPKQGTTLLARAQELKSLGVAGKKELRSA